MAFFFARIILFAACVVASAAFTGMQANAATWTETGDAGELVGTAQSTVGFGALTLISGSLIDLGEELDDIDLYRITILDPDAFSVITSASLSVDNDAMLFVFDAAGNLVFFNDDSVGFLPGIDAGDLTGNPAGSYLLGINLFFTLPTSDPLAGWDRDPDPFQTGPYDLTLTGAGFDSDGTAVPEPATLALLGAGLAGIGFLRRRRSA